MDIILTSLILGPAHLRGYSTWNLELRMQIIERAPPAGSWPPVPWCRGLCGRRTSSARACQRAICGHRPASARRLRFLAWPCPYLKTFPEELVRLRLGRAYLSRRPFAAAAHRSPVTTRRPEI